MVNFAQAVELLAPLPGGQSTVTTLDDYLAAAFPLFIQLVALFAVVMIAWGGLEYMFSKIPGSKTEGKERIRYALLGLLLALSAYLILKTINPDITGSSFTETLLKETP